MIDNNLKNSPAYRVAYSMYVALGGDPTIDFDSVEAIYDAIDVLYGEGNNRITVEAIAMEIVENGDYNFDDEEVTGYKPVNIKVDVPQKYTDEQVETIRVEAETTGYNNGYGVGYAEGDAAGQQTGYNTGYTEGFTQGETEGYNDGYAEGLDDGAEDQKALLEDITITENGVYEKEDGYKKVTVEIANTGGGSGFDFSVIGYDTNTSNQLNDELRSTTQDAIDYSKQIYDNWNPNVTSMVTKYSSDIKLKFFPIVNTSNVTNMSYAFQSCYNLTSIPQLDTSKVTNMSNMFVNCYNLTSIPQLDTSNVTNMSYMFGGCFSLTSIPQLDTSNVTDMSYMFQNCYDLTTIPQFDTSNVTKMQYMFDTCYDLTSIPQFNTSNVTTMNNMFVNCTNLTSIPELDCSKVTAISYFMGYGDLTKLTDIGGFKNLGEQSTLTLNSNYQFNKAPNMTHASAMNIINNLYDRASAGYSVLTLKLHANTLALLSDEEKAIATNKGWTLS